MIRFTCKVTGGFEMREADAERLLAIIGKQVGERGIVTPGQIPGAIAALRAAAGGERAQDKAARAAREASGDDGDEAVSLSQRAFPLIDMLERAQAANEPVLWGV